MEPHLTEWREGRVLFIDVLNTFYLWLSGIEYMVKKYSDREETCYQHFMGYYFQLASSDFYMHYPTDRLAHVTAFVNPVMEHWLKQEKLSGSIMGGCSIIEYSVDITEL